MLLTLTVGVVSKSYYFDSLCSLNWVDARNKLLWAVSEASKCSGDLE